MAVKICIGYHDRMGSKQLLCLQQLGAFAAFGPGFQFAGRDPVFSPTFSAAHFIGFFRAGFLIRGRQRLMAFAAFGSCTHSIGRNSIGRAAAGASSSSS